MKNTKKVYLNFKYKECDSFAEYLHDMSLQGWHFTGWRMGMIFEKGTPKDITYAVEVFPKGDELDLKPEAETEEYAEYCSAAGWELIDAQRKFCIFKRIADDAEEIVTPQERFDNIKKAEWKKWRSESILQIALSIMYLYNFLNGSFKYQIFDNTIMFLHITLWFFALSKIFSAFSLIIWTRNCRLQLSSGERPKHLISKGKPKSIIGTYIFVLIVCTAVILIENHVGLSAKSFVLPAVLGIFSLTNILTSYFKISRDTNYLVQDGVGLGVILFMFAILFIVNMTDFNWIKPVSADEVDREKVPLLQEDYKEMEDPLLEVAADGSKGILGSRVDNTVRYGTLVEPYGKEISDSLYYEVYYCEYDWILDKIWKDISRFVLSSDIHMDCTDEWDAEYAVTDPTYHYCIRYENGIISMYADEELNPEQIAIIRDKLSF